MSFLSNQVMELMVAAILIVVSLVVLTQVALTQRNESLNEANQTAIAYLQGNAMTTAVGGFATWYPIFVVVAAAAIIISRLGLFQGAAGSTTF